MAEGDAAPAATEVDPGKRRVVAVVDSEIVVALVGEDPQLRGEVGVEVGWRSRWSGARLRKIAHSGAKATLSSSWKLEHSQTMVASRSTSPTSRESGVPTLPATATGSPAVAVEVPEQLHRGRLAVGPGHREEAVGKRPPGELELSDHVDPALQGGGDHRRLPRNPRALDNCPHSVEKCQSIRIQNNFDTHSRKPCNPLRDARSRPPGQAPPLRASSPATA